MSRVTHADPWQELRQHTAARIAQGRAGHALPTAELLRFELDHARARDAVHTAPDWAALLQDVQGAGLIGPLVHSQAPDRRSYLLRPDLGRCLRVDAVAALHAFAEAQPEARGPAIVVTDGLSARAVQDHAAALLHALARIWPGAWGPARIVPVAMGRVAVGDPVGELLGAPLVVVLVGERPGMSSPDSLGAYLTWAPRTGRMDSERNCVSNIRPEGLPLADAAMRIVWLATQAMALGLSGVQLKDESPAAGLLDRDPSQVLDQNS